jgi:hypothetical protein
VQFTLQQAKQSPNITRLTISHNCVTLQTHLSMMFLTIPLSSARCSARFASEMIHDASTSIQFVVPEQRIGLCPASSILDRRGFGCNSITERNFPNDSSSLVFRPLSFWALQFERVIISGQSETWDFGASQTNIMARSFSQRSYSAGTSRRSTKEYCNALMAR